MQPFNPAEFLILVVDDVSKNLQILGSILDEVGYSTTFAISGLQALERLETAKPDLILLDMMMPDMNGLEVCRILKSDPGTAEIPVIFLTVSQETEHILQAFDRGAVDYLTKPFNTRELLARVRNHLELKHTRDELKKALKELVESRDAALKSAQVKSQFLANMSHEIRTPMNGVLGMTELLWQTPLNPQQIDYVQTLRNSGNNLLVIINEILDYSKLESGEMRLDYEEFELKTRLADITKFFQLQMIDKDLTLSLIYDESIPQTIIGDFHKIRQILTNLIGNAVKFTETGEIQVIVTKKSGLYREINHEKLTDNQGFADKRYQNRCQLIFEVKDTGIGIRPEDRAQIFKSFFQAESSPSKHYAGTGLGLAICEQLVQLMNGKIGVESEFGKGSKFWFTINLEFLSPDMAAGNLKDLNGLKTNSITDNQQIETEHKSLESLRILVVEDTRINQKVILQQLKGLGCTADCVNNGQEALFQLDAADYDLILMDCQMPVLDGYAATEAIREREQQAQEAMRSRSGADALSRSGADVRSRSGADALSGGGPDALSGSGPDVRSRSGADALSGGGADVRSRSGADALSGTMSNLPSLGHGSGGSYPKSRVVVIGLTAYAMKGDREKCLAAGMDDYLSKPVSVSDLSAMLRKWTGN